MKRPRGSLLIEVTIAASLAALAVIAVAQLLAVVARQEHAIKARSVATQEAANALERTLVRAWDELTDRTAESTLPADAAAQLTDGQLSVAVTPLNEQPIGKQVVAEVTWLNRAGQRERVRLVAWKWKAEP